MEPIIETVSQAISYATATASAGLEEIARSNITQRINCLRTVNETETFILNGIDKLVSHVKLGAEIGRAAEFCAGQAIWKLSEINASIGVDEHLALTARGLKICLETESESHGLEWDKFMVLLLVFFIMSLIFGSAWPILLPLRVIGFGALGVRAGSVAAWLQSCLYGGFTPAAGWFARLTRFGMVQRFFLSLWPWVAAILGIAVNDGGHHTNILSTANGFTQTVLAWTRG